MNEPPKADPTPKQMSEAVVRPLDNQVNPNSKDSVFCDLFDDPQYLIQLYSALHPEDDTTTIEDITLVTLEHRLLRAQYNDLGFIVGNKLVVLVEHQSTWTYNILLRMLMYLGETYQRYVKNNDLNVYGTKLVEVPRPELYVIYPKDRKDRLDEMLLSRDVFGIEDPSEAFVDVRVKIIYDGKQGDIINQYVIFSRVFDEQIKIHGKTELAVKETIRICREQNVLKDYLAREEAASIMFGGFDEEKQMEYLMKEERAEGRAEGRVEGRVEGREEGRLEALAGLVNKNYLTIAQAADEAKMTQSEFAEKTGLSLV